jgi:(1->4)-alpha-D-glucan 1-alpha-D-glucosylmutase
MTPPRIPVATYRLQFNKDFRFAHAVKILDYLHDLGISDIYASPVLASRKGSGHGYDVTDPTKIDPELGSAEEFGVLQGELEKRGMGIVLDIVPNHMAASGENPWWMDVLENGQESAFASYFDIDWHPPVRSLDGKILLPVLGRPFGEVLDAGELHVVLQEGRFFIQYFESLFPVAPRSYEHVLSHRLDALKIHVPENSPPYDEYSGVLAAFRSLAGSGPTQREGPAERRASFEAARERLREMFASHREITVFVNDALKELNGTPHDPASFGFLERLLSEQNFKLSYWQNVNESINYRRFFTISDLVGVRVEDPIVFEATHGQILRLMSSGSVTGLRIDHVDGLRDPAAYLNRLQERLAAAREPAGEPRSAYIIVEKILSRSERLPLDWPVSGTTGYEYLNYANGIFVPPENGKRFEEIYARFIGRDAAFADLLYQKKKLVMSTLLGVEMRALGRQLGELAGLDRYARDLPRLELMEALIEATAALPIYRTYIRNLEVPPDAKQIISGAIDSARARKPHLNSACFDFVRDVLCLLSPPHVLPEEREARLAFVMRWQQFTGPIVAKGCEDTALYVYHPLLSLNEVGGDPTPTAVPHERDFFAFLLDRQSHWPGGLNATTTHDTKRSEGVRARLNALSEMPDRFQACLERWSRQNAVHKEEIGGHVVPDRNEEYFLYQTLIGAWPLEGEDSSALTERIQAYVLKATREAMVHTRWTRPNEKHEAAVKRFIASILADAENNPFLLDFVEFEKDIAFLGMINSLSQTLLKITCPGVPDFYQGSELWDFRLVDPDNRGPVDFAQRVANLESLKNGARPGDNRDFVREVVEGWGDGRIKQFLIWKALDARREHPLLFSEGQLERVRIAGMYERNVVAYLRRHDRNAALVVIPRWLSYLDAHSERDWPNYDWKDTRVQLPDSIRGAWRDAITGKRTVIPPEAGRTCFLPVSEVLSDFPVALLLYES